MKMKALRSFGIAGSNEGHIRRGVEFDTATDVRAKELEEHGLAYPVSAPIETKMDRPLANKMQPPPENKAAHSGPLPFAGGETGEDKQPSSSHQGHQPRARRSRR